MIQQAETLIEYGYLPMDLPRRSNKPILAACDNCGKVRETSKNYYTPFCKSCAHKGNIFSEEHKANISAAMKGKRNCLGYNQTEEAKANTSAAMTGRIFTEEHKASLSAAQKGENNPNRQGGISFEPYCVKFNEAFKEYIRSKFGFKCFLCPTTQAENGRKLSVHHVNYNKDCSCDGDLTCKFIPLCISCHAKTNYNRDYWQKIITDKLHCLIIGWNV